MIVDRAISPTAAAMTTEPVSWPVQVHTRPERHAPETVARCHRCNRETPTTYRLARSGHVLNACALCGTARLGRPYVPRHYLTDPEGPQMAAKGVHADSAR